MADEPEKPAEGAEGGAPAPSGGGSDCPEKKCKPCPAGLPGWLATFSDLCTLLLTFFVLLLSFAKTETSKYDAAMGSVRNAFGGNVLKKGEVMQLGKSPDDAPTILDAQDVMRPFPIDFMSTEGFLDKREINRESDEQLSDIRKSLDQNDLAEDTVVEEIPEGIKARIKDPIYFVEGTIDIKETSVRVIEKLVDMLKENDWVVFVEGHAAKDEKMKDDRGDAYTLSSERSLAVTRFLIQRGVRPEKITSTYYGDSRPDEAYKKSETQKTSLEMNRRVEFTIRKNDLRSEGHFVPSM